MLRSHEDPRRPFSCPRSVCEVEFLPRSRVFQRPISVGLQLRRERSGPTPHEWRQMVGARSVLSVGRRSPPNGVGMGVGRARTRRRANLSLGRRSGIVHHDQRLRQVPPPAPGPVGREAFIGSAIMASSLRATICEPPSPTANPTLRLPLSNSHCSSDTAKEERPAKITSTPPAKRPGCAPRQQADRGRAHAGS